MKKSAIYYEVSAWAGRKYDSLIRPPFFYTRREERQAWQEGYKWAMNEVSQHFNMERFKAEREEE